MESRVFILEATHLDTSGASAFGKVVFLFSGSTRRASIWSPDFHRDVLTALTSQGFDPKRDYFAAAGRAVPLIQAIVAILTKHREVRVLMHNSTERNYVERHFHVDEFTETV